jgi:hypothetical protein
VGRIILVGKLSFGRPTTAAQIGAYVGPQEVTALSETELKHFA